MSEKKPEVPFVGVIYGEITYWITLAGLIIGIIGIAISLAGSSVMDTSKMVTCLWEGKSVKEIWKEAAGQEIPHGHWYLKKLSYGDAIAMLGIAVMSIAGVVGMWASAVIFLARDRDKLYGALAVIVAVILLLCAAGVIALKH